MAWGTKVVRFDNGEKVKIGNAVLEEIHAAIIRDYVTTTKEHNKRCNAEETVKIFGEGTYRRWLKVYLMCVNYNLVEFHHFRLLSGQKAPLWQGLTTLVRVGRYYKH